MADLQAAVSTDQLELAINMLTVIASTAHAADRQAYFLPLDCDREALELHADAMRDIVCRMGWIAERALTHLGETGSFAREGKAENWLMPPVCRGREQRPCEGSRT